MLSLAMSSTSLVLCRPSSKLYQPYLVLVLAQRVLQQLELQEQQRVPLQQASCHPQHTQGQLGHRSYW
jgi:hypothetical protein